VLWTMAIILFVLWGLGLASGAQLGVWVHLLLAFAAVTAFLAALHPVGQPGLVRTRARRR
jgi:hypothetical protein